MNKYFYKGLIVKISSFFLCKKEENMQVEEGKFYFMKDEFFDKIDEKLLCLNRKGENKRPCYYCFKDAVEENIFWFLPISSKVEKYKIIYEEKKKKYGKVDNIVFGYVEGEERVFLIQNMFPTLEKYIKQKKDVIVNQELKRELKRKANKILTLVEKGYRNLVFPDIIKIKEILLEENHTKLSKKLDIYIKKE